MSVPSELMPNAVGLAEQEAPDSTTRQHDERTIAALIADAQSRRAEAEAFAARVSVYFRANPVPGLIARRGDATLVDVNDAFVALLGYRREELVGRSLSEAGVFADPLELAALLGRLDRIGQTQVELTLRTRAGEARSVLSFFELTDIAGEACLIVGCVDLTEQKRSARMEQQQQVVEEANRAKSAFLANISHELRTPLNAILGFSELLLEQLDLSSRHKGFLNNVHDAGEHLMKLINDVLDISRVEAGKMELRREPMTLSGLLAPLIARTRLAAETRGVRFEVADITPSVLQLDPTRVRQILDNLLSNAVKFTEPGGSVTLNATVEGDEVLIEVRDSGIGIPPESHGRVFGTFERFHERIGGATGTGLGLALTKALVELHGGSIRFVSALGTGTTFFVRLPASLPRPIAATGPRVLIVEDARRDADLIVALVERRGFSAVVVATVAEALSWIESQTPVGIVLDLALPDGRGELILRTLRDRGQRIPTVVVTGTDDEAGAGLGVDDHIRKPIEAARFDRWLARLSDAGEGAASAHPSR